MKARLGDVRRLIREEAMNGVPEWQLRRDIEDLVERVRDRIARYVILNKSVTGVQRQEAMAAMNDVCDELEDSLYAVLEDKLYAFMRRV